MNAMPTSCANLAPSADALAIHLLHALTTSRRRVDLDDLARAVGARRADVRSTLSAMHRDGWIDVLRMRPTLQGFALGRALASARLKPMREAAVRAVTTRAA